MTTVVRRSVFGAVCWLLLAGIGYAQQATLSGTITDATGGVLPGVTITATHEASGQHVRQRSPTSAAATGCRSAPGVYRILVELPGFTTVTRRPGAAGRPAGGRQPRDVAVDRAGNGHGHRRSAAHRRHASTVAAATSIRGRCRSCRSTAATGWTCACWRRARAATPADRESPTGSRHGGYFQLNIDGQQVTQQRVAAGTGSRASAATRSRSSSSSSNRFDATQGRSIGVQVNAITKSGTNTLVGLVLRLLPRRPLQRRRLDRRTRAAVFRTSSSARRSAGRSCGTGCTSSATTSTSASRTRRLQHAVPGVQHRPAVHPRRARRARCGVDYQFSPQTRLTVRGNKSDVPDTPDRAAAAPRTTRRASSTCTRRAARSLDLVDAGARQQRGQRDQGGVHRQLSRPAIDRHELDEQPAGAPGHHHGRADHPVPAG